MVDRDILLPTSDEEAERRFNLYRQDDPFPEIPPALLNSSNIYDYVCATGMIYPFYREQGGKKYLSGASYSVRIEGEVCYFEKDKNGTVRRICKNLTSDGDGFDLGPNSIAYVTLEPYFRMPDYLIIRFNLKITHIYKGLLLGTGPMVDPGFEGKLAIPLHNFTSNEYHFNYHDELIQMEFTKMVDIHRAKELNWGNKYLENRPQKGREIEAYLSKALKGSKNPYVISSIPDATDEAKKDAEKAKKSAKKLEKKADLTVKINLFAMVAIIVSCMAICFAMINSVNSRIDKIQSELQFYKAKVDDPVKELEKFKGLENQFQKDHD